MKKKLLLSSLLLMALLFSSCNLAFLNTKMSLVNDSNETITSIEVSPFLDVNSKVIGYIHDSLGEAQVVAPNESVGYTLPNVASDSIIRVLITSESGTRNYYINFEKEANFTVHYNGYSEGLSITGTGASTQDIYT
jgi:hypothetical protein